MDGARRPEVEVGRSLLPHAAENPAQIDDHPAAELSARQRSGAGVCVGAVAEAEVGGYVGAVVPQQLPGRLLHDGRVSFGLFYACDCDAEGCGGGRCVESSLAQWHNTSVVMAKFRQ